MTRPLDRFCHRLASRGPLDPEDRAVLLAIDAQLVAKRRRVDLVRPAERVNFACLVADGVVGRAEQFADGRRQTTAVFVAGDMADLHSVPVPLAAWALTALTDCTVWQVPHTALQHAADRYPGIARALWRDTVADASILSKWVSVLGRHPARKRLAHFLCELGYRMEIAGLGSRDAFELTLTQDQLAEVLGTTTVHVYRTFKALRGEGVIDAQRRAIRVLDMPALVRIADFDATYLLLD